MNYRRDDITYLEGDSISPSNAYKAKVEEYAAQVASALHFEIGENPSTIVENLGGRVRYENMNELVDEAGSIFIHDKFDFDILLPEYTSPRRDRFTIAHELGHYFLHSSQGKKPIIAYRQGSTRIEWEANWFAAALLMPAERFRDSCRKYRNMTLVATEFGVSEDAAKVRERALNA